MPPRILIAGYYGYGNLGDEAILEVMARDLQREMPGASLTVISGDPRSTQDQHGLPAIHRHDFRSLIETLKDTDLMVIGGGGLFNDYWAVDLDRVFTSRQSGLEYYSSLPLLGQLSGVPSMLYGVGLGPLENSSARDLVAQALKCCRVVTVRDSISESIAAWWSGGRPRPCLRN